VDNTDELLKAIRMQSEMLALVAGSQESIIKQQQSILLAMSTLSGTIGDFCDSIREAMNSSQEKESQ